MDPTGKNKQVYVFRKGCDPFLSNIESVAAARDFYSTVSADNSKTLDDVIADYEGGRLANLVNALRAADTDHPIDPMIAAEVIAHLAPRTSHIRSVFRAGMTEVVDLAREVFTNEYNLAQYIGINSLNATESFQEKIVNPIFEKAEVANIPAPKALVVEVIYWVLRENFENLFAEQNPIFAPLLAMLADRAEDLARDGHVKVMEGDLAPPLRVEDLSKLSWAMEGGPSEGTILPDCVAIAYDSKNEPYPYMLVPRDELNTVVLPISKDKVLVGRKQDGEPISGENLNRHLAECSYEFFVSGSDAPLITGQSASIGERALTVIQHAMEHARTEVLPRPSVYGHSNDQAAESPGAEEQRQPGSLSLSFSIRLFDFGDQDAAQQVAENLRGIVAEMVQKVPVSRLDGFTFALNQPQALRELDRGFELREEELSGDADGSDLASTPLVVREGTIKRNIMCSASLADGLLTEDIEMKQWSVNVIIRLIAAATITEMVDLALPGELLKPAGSAYEATLSHGFGHAHESYFSAYVAAGFGDGGAIETFQRVYR